MRIKFDTIHDTLSSWSGGTIDSIWISGSHAYGLADADSDIDVRGFALRSREDILTSTDFGTYTRDTPDIVLHSFDKFVHLLKKGNPDVIHILGLKDKCVLQKGSALCVLSQNADAFLTKRSLNAFGGYATAQLKRLENGQDAGKEPRLLAKHMCHTIRLLRMGTEIAEGEGVIVDRRDAGDADELLEIKHGLYLNDDVVNPQFFKLAQQARTKFYEVCEKSKLPETVHEQLVRDILVEVNGWAFEPTD